MKKSFSQKGQSVVETALILPVLVMFIAGIVEFGNFMVTKNRVSSAARSATRFGVRGGEDEGMAIVALNTITQTMPADTDRWDMWSVRGQINEFGNGFVVPPVWEHIYGLGQTATYTQTDQRFINNEIQNEILAELRNSTLGITDSDVSDTEFVATYVSFDTEPILGLGFMIDLINSSKTMSQLHVMRRTGLNVEQTDGCTGVFPIAIEEGIRSVKETQYPTAATFDYPTPAPDYGRFINHVENIPIKQAREGYIYLVDGGRGLAQFYWLKWNSFMPHGPSTLNNSLAFPGNSHVYSGSPEPGYKKYDDITDTTMHKGEDVWLNEDSGNWGNNIIGTTLQEHIQQKRTFRVVTYQRDPSNNDPKLTMNGFAIMRLRGLHQSSSPTSSWLLLEFIRWDTSCGQVSGQ